MRVTNRTNFVATHFLASDDPTSVSLTIAVKGTFVLRPDGVCTPAEKQLPFTPDKTFMDELGRGPEWASDFAPFKPHSDFFIFGAFHAPNGVPVPEGSAGFSFGPFNKTLLFLGPRFAVPRPTGARRVSEPEPMTTVPLRWELSFGGLADARNPIGRGLDLEAGADGVQRIAMPQIEWPDQRIRRASDRPPPANFAPMPKSFLERRKKLGTHDRRWAVSRAPLPPKDYDPSFHNAAPADQQAGNYPHGDEVLVLRNLHPRIPDLTTRLPGLRIRAGLLRRSGKSAAAEDVTMNLDTVIALPENDQLVLLWRGVASLKDAKAFADVIFVQIEVEKLATPPKPFAELSASMLATYKASLPPPPKPPPPRPDLEKLTASTMKEVRDLLGKADLPPDLRQIVDTGNDPEVVHDALARHVEKALAELEAKYGVKPPE